MPRLRVSLFVLLGLLATPASAGAETRPEVWIPKEDRGTWVPENEPCSSPMKIKIDGDKFSIATPAGVLIYKEVQVYYGCASGSAMESIAHCLFPSRDELPFSLFMFPGSNRNKLIYDVWHQDQLQDGLPREKVRFRRCGV